MSEQQSASVPKRIVSEVPLKYSEFLWSLEKLRYKDYGPKMQERDWFQVNPLEVVLLGCKTLCAGQPARRDQGTLILVMEDLTPYMSDKPRFWLRLLRILLKTIEGKNVPVAMKNRCCMALTELWKHCRKKSIFSVGCQGWFVSTFYQSLEGFLTETDVAVGDARFDLEKLVDILSTLKEEAVLNILQPMSEVQNAGLGLELLLELGHKYKLTKCAMLFLHHWLSQDWMDKQAAPPEHLVIKLYLSCDILSNTRLDEVMIDQSTKGKEATKVTGNRVVLTLLSTISSTCSTPDVALSSLLDLLTVVAVRMGDTDILSLSTEIVSSEEFKEPVNCKQITSFLEFLSEVEKAIRKWYDLAGQVKSTVPISILQLAIVMLSPKEFEDSLIEAVAFFNLPVSYLMQYAWEGYLSDEPNGLMNALFSYVCTSVEAGESPNDVLMIQLPNLFGPIFGVRDHRVSLELLKYGELSANSRLRKQLLKEGIHHIIGIYRLYQPLEIKHAASVKHMKRYEAVCGVLPIVRDLLMEVERKVVGGLSEQTDLTGASSRLVGSEFHDLGEDSEVAGDEEEPSVTDIEEDRRMRVEVLLKLLQLANAMVMNGDDINFIFRSELPKLLYQQPSNVHVLYNSPDIIVKYLPPLSPPNNANMWSGDKRQFGIQALDLTVKAASKDVATPFKVLGIVIPKLAHNIDRMCISDTEKIAMVTDLCQMTSEIIDKGGDIEELIGNGLELISLLLIKTSSPEEFKDFVGQMLEHLLKPSQTSVLFLIRHAAQTLLQYTEEEERELISKFFRKLVFKGRKNEIRCVYRVANREFCQEKYSFARKLMYQFAEGGLSGKQLAYLAEVLAPILVLDKGPVKTPHVTMIEEEDPEDAERHVQEELNRRETVQKLLSPCIEALKDGLAERFSKDVCEDVAKRVSLIALFSTLFWSEIPLLYTQSVEEIQVFFQSKLPASLLNDATMMSLLGTVATRLEHMQVPRYASLKKHLVTVVEYLVAASPPETATIEQAFDFRSQSVQKFILELPWNKDCYQRLLECGYSERIWKEHIENTMRTDGSFSLEENLRQSLLANFAQYSDILLQLKIRHVDVDGDIVETHRLFSEELTLTELKGRRALAVKTIDAHLGPSKEGLLQEKKIALLMKEDEIESSIEKQSQQPLRPQSFKCVFNTSFMDCMKCCDGNIIGCYAPNGEHCERPLEIGLRYDSGIISIYDSKNVEIENVEVLFCEEGLYVFKSYSNGHPYDTAQVWVSMFSKLLSEPLVPAVIVPEGYPNESSWKLLHQSVPTEVTGSMLTCQFDISAEWHSYYDNRPERIRCGKDIVLYPHFALKGSGSVLPQLLQRQRSKLTKDLAGMMFDCVIQDILTDPAMQEFRVLGKILSLYISKLVQSGVGDREIISRGFDYSKWKKSSGASSEFASYTKEAIVLVIKTFVDDHITEWLSDLQVAEFLQDYPKQAIELKIYLEKVLEKTRLHSLKYKQLRSLLLKCIRIMKVNQLPEALQIDLMHWIFNNEDRVWRYRGGRDRCETLQQYLKFLGPVVDHDHSGGDSSREVFPGIVISFSPTLLHPEETDKCNFKISDVIGYAVGEVVVSTPSIDAQGDALLDTPTPEGHTHEIEHVRVPEGASKPIVAVRNHDNQEGGVLYHPQSQYYEVVTAWVHPNFRRLGLGVTMYLDIIKQAPAGLVVCDMLRGSVNHIILSSGLFRMLRFLRLVPLIVTHQTTSYAVDTQVGPTEQFERVVFRVWPIRLALWIKSLLAGTWHFLLHFGTIFSGKSDSEK